MSKRDKFAERLANIVMHPNVSESALEAVKLLMYRGFYVPKQADSEAQRPRSWFRPKPMHLPYEKVLGNVISQAAWNKLRGLQTIEANLYSTDQKL